MPANTNPIFVVTPHNEWGKLLTANTAKDGTGTVVTLFTAGANGSRVEKLTVLPLGTNVQTVLRVFLNNGSSNGVDTNNSLITEITIPENTVSETAKSNMVTHIFNDGLTLKAGEKLLATIGTTIASGIQATVFGGDF